MLEDFNTFTEEQFIIRCKPLVFKLARIYAGQYGSCQLDDLTQESYIALIEYFRATENKIINFCLISRIIITTCIDVIRRETKRGKLIWTTFDDLPLHTRCFEHEINVRIELLRLLSRLREKDRNIFLQVKHIGYSQAEVARKYGLTPSKIFQILQQVKNEQN